MKTLSLIISFLLAAQVLFGQYKIDTSFFSESLGEVKMVDVYFPPGYDENPDLYYPVVYYLHGWHADQNDLGSMITWVTYLINNDIIEPCLMVAADNSPDPFDGSCYVNSSLWGNYEDYMVNDLVSWVENSFRAVPQKDYRSLMGHSMGGVGSFRLGLLHPETYCAFAAHAAEVNTNLFIEDIRQELLSENSGPPYSYSWEGGGFFTQWMFLAGGAFTPNSNTPQTYIDPPIVEFPFDENCNLIDTVYQKWQLFDVPAILHNISPDDSVGIFYSCGMNDFLHIFPANLALKDTLDALGFQSVFLPHDGDHVMPPEFKQGGLEFLDSIMGSPLLIPGEPEIIHVPGDYPTIQQGINAATPGDTVLVADGTYYEQINFLGKKPLMVASEFLMDGDTSHIANTIIDGSQLTNPDSASVVYFISGEDTTSVLCGFTIRNGKGTSCFWEEYKSIGGGGIHISYSTATIRNNIIRNNEVNDTLSTVLSGSIGGGIYAVHGTPGWIIIENNKIFDNKIISNHEWTEGGGAYIYCTNARVTNNQIRANLSKNTGYGYGATGGLHCGGDGESVFIEVIIRNNLIENNEVRAVEYGFGGGMGLWFPADGSVIQNNTISYNVNDWIGGGIDMFSGSLTTFKIENNYFIGNEALNGGAIDVDYDSTSQVLLINNVFSQNKAYNQGGAIWINRSNNCPVEHMLISVNNSFYDNHADLAGGAIYTYEDNPVVLNSIFWQNPDLSGDEITVESGYTELAYSNIDTNLIAGDKVVGEGIIFIDPIFDDLDLLTLSELSQCINKGTESFTCQCGTPFSCPEHDIIGILRPQNGLVDMGAYEIVLEGIWDHPLGNAELRHSINPNPFNDQAVLSYELVQHAFVDIFIYNSSGELIQTLLSEHQEAGKHELQFNSGNLPAGIYFYRITTDIKQATGRMIILK